MALSSPNKLAEILRQDFYAFVHRSFLELNPQTPFLPNWHVEVLAGYLELVRLGYITRLIINIPPRHLKTHIASIAFPAWILGHEPATQILSISYAQDLSESYARGCRTLMTRPFYQALFDTRLNPSREAVSEFETLDGGFRLSTSVGGVLTGRGADIIIIDDPLKADDALSEARRRSVNEWYDNTLRSRLNNQETGAIIIVMQRLHIDDLVGHVQQNERWGVLSLPAISEREETYGYPTAYDLNKKYVRSAGTVLHPAQMSEGTLRQIRAGMTEYNFTAQFQQEPQPPSGNVVKRDWLKYYEDKDRPDRFDTILQSWDTANKETELANYSVCTTWGFKDNRIYLLHVLREKMEFPTLKQTVEEHARLHKAQIVLIEDKASGTQLIQQLRSEGRHTIAEAPKLDGDKVMRLRAQTAKFSGGFVLLPKQAEWLTDYVSELIGFPNSKNDDQVDSTVFALAWATENYRGPFYTKEAVKGLESLTSQLAGPWWIR